MFLMRLSEVRKIKRRFQIMMGFITKHIKSALFLAFFISTIVPSQAVMGNIHLGSAEVHPFFSIKEGYIQNIYLDDPNNEKSSGYRSYTPGIRYDWEKTNATIQLDYLYEIINYDIRDVDDKELYDFDSKFDFRFGKSGHGVNLDGGYRYHKTADPLNSEEQAYNRKESDIRFGLRLNLRERFGIAFNSRFFEHRYEDPNWADRRDRDIFSLSSKGTIRPFTKTAFLVEYIYTTHDYKNPDFAINDDSKIRSLLTGIEWEATAKLSGAVKGGYQWKTYKNNPSSPDKNDPSSPETWKVEIDLKQTFSEYTVLQLGFERRIEDSTYQYYENGDPDSIKDAEFYYSNQIRLSLDHKLTYKIGTWIDLTYDYAKYKKIPRKDELWEFDLGFDYKFMDWIWAQVNYYSRKRESNMENVYDYRAHQVSAGLNLLF